MGIFCMDSERRLEKWQPLHQRLMAAALSPSDKCGCPWGKRGFMQRGVVCMAKYMSLIQINKTNNFTENSFIYYYLVRVGSGLLVYANSLSPPVPGVMWRGGPGLRTLWPIFFRYSPPWLMACRGIILGRWQHIPPCAGAPDQWGYTSWDPAGQEGGMQPYFSRDSPYFPGSEQGTLVTSLCLI